MTARKTQNKKRNTDKTAALHRQKGPTPAFATV